MSAPRAGTNLGRQLKPLLQAHPNAVLIADNRTLLAHMLYEVRDLKPAVASWNPAGIASDHYKLTTDLRPWVGRDAVLIVEDPVGEEFHAPLRRQRTAGHTAGAAAGRRRAYHERLSAP